MGRLGIAVLGASGRMGKLVLAEIVDAHDLHLAAAVVRPGSGAIGCDAGMLAGREHLGVPVVPVGPGCFEGADVVIDFSLPDGVEAALPHLGSRALVSGTTGLSAEGDERRRAHARSGPLLVAANFSAGVNLLLELVARASAALPDAALEIVEVHHSHKRDAPSGTALALADAVAGARGVGREAVGVHALRGGDVVGEHTVMLLADGERLALSHSASARSTFAAGAVRAARWIAGRLPGEYLMVQVLGLDGRV